MEDKHVEFQFYLLDINESPNPTEENQIILSGTTLDGKRINIIDKTFKPYFYALAKPGANIGKLVHELKSVGIRKKDDDAEIIAIDAQAHTKNILGKPVKAIKVFASDPKHIPVLKKSAKFIKGVASTEETDIKYPHRYIIDRDIIPTGLYKVSGRLINMPKPAGAIWVEAESIKFVSDTTPNLKIMAFDIETLSSGNFPDAEKDSIIMVSLFANNFKKVITWKRFENAPDYVEFVNGELELIETLFTHLAEQAPDLLVGYGSSTFDVPYIKTRSEKYHIAFKLPPSIDIVYFMRNIYNLESSKYSLDVVAKELLGEGKTSGEQYAAKINEIWSVGLDEELVILAEYNLNDSRLTYLLYLKVLRLQIEIAKLISVPLIKLQRFTYGMLVERYLMKNSKQFNEIIPRAPYPTETKARQLISYEGAYVVEPKPGLFKKLCVFDFRSLYPSIIAGHNISPDTLNCNCCKDSSDITEDGNWFCSKQKGFVSKLVKDIVERRRRIKSIMSQTSENDHSQEDLEARQFALKYIAAAAYGYTGYPYSRWYSIECAKAITYFGRKYVKQAIADLTKSDFEVIYGDTDSLFIILNNKSIEEAKHTIELINSTFPEGVDIEYQGYYPAGLFLGKKSGTHGAKKRYALLSESGNIILKGLEAVRGDWSELAKETQRAVIDVILREGNIEKALHLVKLAIDSVKKGTVPIDKLIINVRLIKAMDKYVSRGPHVAAAEKYAERGQLIKKGSVVKYVVAAGTGPVSNRVALPSEIKAEDCDADYYINHQILRAVFKIFEIFGFTEDKLKFGQSSISDW